MRASRILPILAAGAAIVVGVTGGLVGAQFAAPRVEPVAAPTIEAPVLAPVDDTISLADAARDGAHPVSGTTGSRTVTVPGAIADGSLASDIGALLDEMESAVDPAEVLHRGGEASGSESPGSSAPPADAPADSCSDGGDDCPLGIGGTILPTGGGLTPLALIATGHSNSACPAPDDPTGVRFWVRVNSPANINVRGTDGRHIKVLDLETTAEESDRWFSEFTRTGEAWIEKCVELDGFYPTGSTHVHVLATSLGTGESIRRTVVVAMGERLDVPPTRIESVGSSVLFVSAPHLPTENVVILLLDDTAATGCDYSGYDVGRRVNTMRGIATSTHTADALTSRGFDPRYTKRTSTSYSVPSGATLIACVGWFPAEGGESWDADRPVRVAELSLRAPTYSAPVVTLAELLTIDGVADESLTLRSSTGSGADCGAVTVPSERIRPGRVLCDFAALAATSSANGGYVLTSEVPTDAGLAVNRHVLDAGLRLCGIDGCAAERRVFDVPLSRDVRRGPGCTSDCVIDSRQLAGVARLAVDWPALGPGGNPDWDLGVRYEGGNRVDRDPLPRLDIARTFALTPLDPVTRTQDAELNLRVDRSVSAVVTLAHRASIAVASCPAELRWESAAPQPSHAVQFQGLCAGFTYFATVTLTDAVGAVSVYRYFHEGGRAWAGALIETDTVGSPVVADSLMLINPGDGPLRVESMRVQLWGQELRIGQGRAEQSCWVDDVRRGTTGITPMRLGEVIKVTIVAAIRDVTIADGVDTERFATDACRDVSGPDVRSRLEFTGYLTFDEFTRGSQLTMTDPASGWTAVIQLSPDLEP